MTSKIFYDQKFPELQYVHCTVIMSGTFWICHRKIMLFVHVSFPFNVLHDMERYLLVLTVDHVSTTTLGFLVISEVTSTARRLFTYSTISTSIAVVYTKNTIAVYLEHSYTNQSLQKTDPSFSFISALEDGRVAVQHLIPEISYGTNSTLQELDKKQLSKIC